MFNRRYNFKMYPTIEQAEALLSQCCMAGSLWNALIELQESRYRATRGGKGVVHREGEKSFLTRFDVSNEISRMLESCPEWRELSTWTPRRVGDALVRAYEAFFKRAKSGSGAQSGYPKFKSYQRGEQNWLPHRFASGCKLTHRGGKNWSLYLKGVKGLIHVRGEFPVVPDKYTDADIRFKSGVWWLSVGVSIPTRGIGGDNQKYVVLGSIGPFAYVNDIPVHLPRVSMSDHEIRRITSIQHQMACAKDEKRWDDYRQLRCQKSRMEARIARRRREALHEWTTALTRDASEIVVALPPVKESTSSGRGDRKEWGAAVKEKSELNKHILKKAPAMTAAMLEYKCEEAGVPFFKCTHDDLQVGDLMVQNHKAARKLKQVLKEEKAA